MHIRAVTKHKPLPASNIQEILDVISYILTIIEQVNRIADDLLGKQ